MSPPSTRLPLTALVASRNEARLLERCLPSLAFCDEIVVIDVESSDDTAGVAEAHGAKVVSHEYVPIAEWARMEVAAQARNDWLLFTDPDEEIPPALAAEVARLLPTIPDDVALVLAPIQFYFGDRPLSGTIWGGENRRRFLVRRGGIELSPTVFGGTHLKTGYRILELPFTRDTAIRHMWVSGYRDWIAKHRRYLALEPADRAARGETTGYRAVAATPWRAFRESYLTSRGQLDGLQGILLSTLWAAYRTAAEIKLLRIVRPIGRNR